MGKCVRCGKRGLFLFVNPKGYCASCEQFVQDETLRRAKVKEEKDRKISYNPKNIIGGDIGYLGLDEFWLMLTESEQRAMIRYSRSFLGASSDASPISGAPAYNLTKLSFFSGYLTWSVADKNNKLSDKMIKWAEKYYDSETDYLKKHFYLHTVSEYYYKLRDARKDALYLVEVYCLRDIEIYPLYIEKLSEGCSALPSVPSFKRLAIMYERNEQYDKAIEICKKALEYGLDDGTKIGYSGRIEKLKKKCNSVGM